MVETLRPRVSPHFSAITSTPTSTSSPSSFESPRCLSEGTRITTCTSRPPTRNRLLVIRDSARVLSIEDARVEGERSRGETSLSVTTRFTRLDNVISIASSRHPVYLSIVLSIGRSNLFVRQWLVRTFACEVACRGFYVCNEKKEFRDYTRIDSCT